MRKCRKCHQEKTDTEFQKLKDRKGNYTWQRKICRECDSPRQKKSNKAYRQRHPELIKARFNQWAEKNKIHYKISYCERSKARRETRREWCDLHSLRLSLKEEWIKQFEHKRSQYQQLVEEGRITNEVSKYLLKLWEINSAPSLSPERISHG